MSGIELVTAGATVEDGGAVQQLKPRQVALRNLDTRLRAGIHGPAIENDAIVAHALRGDQWAARNPLPHGNLLDLIEVE